MNTTIGFADDIHPSHSQDKRAEDVTTSGAAIEESIYNPPNPATNCDQTGLPPAKMARMGSITCATLLETSHGRSRRVAAVTWNWKRGDKEPEDDDPGLQRASDFSQKEVYHGRLLFWLAYQSIGAIYGDIGTSPLYVFSSTFKEPPSYKDLVGVLSIVIWSLTMMVTVKYVLVILRADNNGEGGTFSTYSLLSRYVRGKP